MSNAALVVTSYRELLRKAHHIVNGWPRIGDRPQDANDDWPTDLFIEEGKAVLTWLDQDGYEGSTFSRGHSFPAEMLEWSEEQLIAWRNEEEARLAQLDRERSAEYEREREQKERETLAALKAKYGE